MAKKNPQDDTAVNARRLFVFLAFLLVYMNGISVALFIALLTSGQGANITTGILITMIFLGYVIGLFGIFKPYPPLHYGILIASAINLVASIIITIAGGSEGFLQGLLSALVLYLGLRFPLVFADGEITYNTERLLS